MCILWTLLMVQVVSMHLHSCMLFPVWCSALVHTDCESNALTPSICSMVISLMDVMSWVAASIKCYLFCGHSTQATVRSSVYTWIITCYMLQYTCLQYIHMRSFSCINCHCTGVLSNVRTITALWRTDMYLHGYISTLNALANLLWQIHMCGL